MALTQLVNNIASSIDNKETTVGVFLDLSEAFDTVDHHILLKKRHYYIFIIGQALEWISSYLKNRKHFVQFGTSCSRLEPVTCGVPQGSILGHLFFIIYINDLSNASNMVNTLLFADDSSLFYSHKDPNQTIFIMNCEIMKIMDCLKTSNITLDNTGIEQVKVTKFLGVLVDQYLLWRQHISRIARKISKILE